MQHKFNKRAFRRAVWASIARLISVGIGAGAGSLMYQLIGGGITGWGLAATLCIMSFLLSIFAEYERELDE